MARHELPSFDLVLATVDREEQLGHLFASLERQTHRAFRVLLVDQNEDNRLDGLLRDHLGKLEVERLRSPRGLSRARNAALGHLRADLVAFPDDDCVYPDDLLERVARRFAGDPSLDGLTGRASDARGESSPSWARDPRRLTRQNVWNRAISFTIFMRAALLEEVGEFDERLGLGSGRESSSGEETEYLVRALARSARIEYDPDLVVVHDDKPVSPASLRATGATEGGSVGYILRKHGYPLGTLARLLVRPLGGAALSLARGDRARAGFHLSTLRGRIRGYRSR